MSDPLLERVFERDEIADLDPGARRLAIRSLVAQATDGSNLTERVTELSDAVDGFGALSCVMRDETVTDVLVNGPADVWVERSGRLERTTVAFRDGRELNRLIERLLGAAGARVDASRPIADARLADGSRAHVVLPPVATSGPIVSIRRFPPRPLSIDDLVLKGMLAPGEAVRLRDCVEGRKSMLISGGTGTGKTTLLNALLEFVDGRERVVTIEETPELRPLCPHVVSLVARPANVEGCGEVKLSVLVHAALRMRPDRIIVGEVRGAEALDALRAMSTGHGGSMLTVHAPSARAALERMVSLALLASSGAAESSLGRQFRGAFDIVVHLRRDEGGIRRVEHIYEVE